jgi:hypothetical protein
MEKPTPVTIGWLEEQNVETSPMLSPSQKNSLKIDTHSVAGTKRFLRGGKRTDCLVVLSVGREACWIARMVKE